MEFKLNEFWWRIRYAFDAIKRLHCSPKYAWRMASAIDYDSTDMATITPKDALEEELSYWDWESK